MALKVLVNKGDNFLLPRPGFPLYRTILEHLGVEARFYDLLVTTVQLRMGGGRKDGDRIIFF